MYAVKIKELRKNYKKFEALKSINLEIKSWDFFALLWVNGAGKTTLIWILTDLVTKTSWTVEVFWVDIDKDFSQAKRFIWVVPQEFNLDIFSTVIDVLLTQAWYFWMKRDEAMSKAEFLLQELGLYDKKDGKVIALSGGMKRRLMIARALMHDPKLLILDEPTAWIDINLRKSTYEFLEKLNKNGMTILLTTHYLEEVERLCNTLAVIKNGEIIINTSKKEFFAQMEASTFEITLDKEYQNIPALQLYSHTLSWNILHISISKQKTLNEIFEILNTQNIWYMNITNITNELETLFESLTQ